MDQRTGSLYKRSTGVSTGKKKFIGEVYSCGYNRWNHISGNNSIWQSRRSNKLDEAVSYSISMHSIIHENAGLTTTTLLKLIPRVYESYNEDNNRLKSDWTLTGIHASYWSLLLYWNSVLLGLLLLWTPTYYYSIISNIGS